MSSRESADVRRQSLIAATASTLAEKGLAGASVRSICARANVSPGLLTHYFPGVDALIAETYRATTEQVAATLAAAVDQAGPEPLDRVTAFLTASFRPPIAEPELLATWLAFWSAAKTDRAVAAIHSQSYRGYREQLEQLLRGCGMPDAHAGLAAIALTALVDGLWLELSLDPSTFSYDQASTIVVRWLDALLERPSL
jgi:AcrR family transcriptional regulator